jgi:hypothetical protein
VEFWQKWGPKDYEVWKKEKLCEACGFKINPQSDFWVFNGKYYHDRCVKHYGEK